MMASKLMAGAIAMLLIVCFGLGWQLKQSLTDVGVLKAREAQLVQDVQDWERSFNDMEQILIDTNVSLEDNMTAKRSADKLSRKWMTLYEQEKARNQELADWSAAAPPTIWWDGVRQYVSEHNQKRSSETSTTE